METTAEVQNPTEATALVPTAAEWAVLSIGRIGSAFVSIGTFVVEGSKLIDRAESCKRRNKNRERFCR